MQAAEHLLWLAEKKIQSAGGGSSMMKRRAVSTAYYAVFHAVAFSCTQALLSGASPRSVEYERVYRSLEHSVLKNAENLLPECEARLRVLAKLVAKLQRERNRSDYLPKRKLYLPEECSGLLQDARTAIDLLKLFTVFERRALAVYLLFKSRPL